MRRTNRSSAYLLSKRVPPKGAVTDLDGQFRLDVANGTTLVVSYVGYDTKEVKAANGMTIKLQPNANVLDEVVAVGYGVMKKSVVTASIAKVDANALQTRLPYVSTTPSKVLPQV